MYEQIAREIHNASRTRQKAAMIHYQVLLNAELLRDADIHEFCEKVGIQATYHTEVSKMLALAKLMAEKGVALSEPQ